MSWKHCFSPRFLIGPLCAWAFVVLFHVLSLPGWMALPAGAVLISAVMASVHFAEVIAHRIGEPFGSLVLALAVTVIEVALILSVVISGDPSKSFLARDTIFATVILILNGLVGLCLLFGAAKHYEQRFRLQGVSGALAALAALTVITLVLPNYTIAVQGPAYSPLQLAFVAVVSLVLYGTFVLVQTVRHRHDFSFSAESTEHPADGTALPSKGMAWASLGALLFSLGGVVLLAKSLSPTISAFVESVGLPQGVVGIVIALIVLLPEGITAVRAARANQLQNSLNLALGSALATIGLTIPAIALASLLTHTPLPLGLDTRDSILLGLSLLVATISLGTGRTTVLQGAVHLVIFAVFLFVSFFP